MGSGTKKSGAEHMGGSDAEIVHININDYLIDRW